MKERQYRISLNEATREQHGYSVKYRLTERSPEVTITARSFDEIGEAAQALVELSDWPMAAAYVRVHPEGRKPAGFDAWRDTHRYYEKDEATA
jgi:hypothetical protein